MEGQERKEEWDRLLKDKPQLQKQTSPWYGKWSVDHLLRQPEQERLAYLAKYWPDVEDRGEVRELLAAASGDGKGIAGGTAGGTAGGAARETEPITREEVLRLQKETKAEILRQVETHKWKNKGSTTFAEYFKSISSLAKENTSFWVSSATPLPAGFVAWPSLPPTSGREKKYQSFFVDNLKPTLEKIGSKYAAFDTHKNSYLDGRKPDVSFVPEGSDLSIATVAFVGELKKKIDGHFSSSHKGEVLTFAERILHVQPFRNEVTVFLSDCHVIQFFRVQRQHDSTSYSWTAVQPLYEKQRKRQNLFVGPGFRWLASLLISKPEEIGFDVEIPRPRFTRTVQLVGFLGSGATSYVYETAEGQVVKILQKEKFELAEHEKTVLLMLAHLKNPSVPNLIEGYENKEHKRGMLLMTPKGEPMKNLLCQNVKELLKVLSSLHRLGWVHRDVRPGNLLVYEGRLLLTDFGFAVKASESAVYCGTVHYASNHVLQNLKDSTRNFKCTSADDLASVVRSVLAMTFPLLRLDLEKIAGNDFSGIMNFWTATEEQLPAWKPCFQPSDPKALRKALAALIY